MLPTNAGAWILVGGALGSWLRVVFIQWLAITVPGTPIGMLFVNITGSFCIGVGYHLLNLAPSIWLKYCILGGFLGALTTFSTYALDVVILIQDRKLGQALMFGVLVPCLSIVAVYAGLSLAKRLVDFP